MTIQFTPPEEVAKNTTPEAARIRLKLLEMACTQVWTEMKTRPAYPVTASYPYSRVDVLYRELAKYANLEEYL